MYKIGIIGSRADTLLFLSLGFTAHEADNKQDAAKALCRLVESGEYAVLFITEVLAKELEEDIARYKDLPLPAITVIPGKEGSTGYAQELLREAVVRAAGTDLLSKS